MRRGYFWRGKINYRQQKWGEAMNDFGKVLE
jgi:TolA-binding protein